MMNFVMNRSKQKSLLYLYISAMQNEANSQSALGNKYFNGFNVGKDCQAAALYYYQAVKSYYYDKVL